MPLLPLSLTVHDPTLLSHEERLEVAQLDVESVAYASPDDPPLVPEMLAEELRHAGEDEDNRLVLARLQGQLVGRVRLEYALSQNTDKIHAGVVVHPAHRRQGIGRALAVRAAELALELGRVSYTSATSSRSPQSEQFAAGLGARGALPMVVSEVRLDALDHEQLERWVTRPADDAYVLHRFERVPEHELARVAAVMGVMNTAPRGELDFDDWTITPAMVQSWQDRLAASGERRLLYAAEHRPSGVLVGYTEVFWHPERAILVHQGATGVHPDHRGQGLGKWLKAALLQDLPAANPEAVRVRTGNADSNEAMLGINRALGFLPAFRRMEWQGEVRDVLATVRGQKAPMEM